MDEAHFNLNRNENTKNYMHWADANPHAVAALPFFKAKVTMCYSITGIIILGWPLSEEAIPSSFVTISRYIAILQNYVMPELLWQNAQNDIIWM